MNAEYLLANFSSIAGAPGGVKRLRELVLHLAVSGRLVSRLLSEAAAEASIAEAIALKHAYRRRFQLDLSHAERSLRENEQAHDIPSYWKWERLGNIACYIQRGKGPKYDDAGRVFVVSQKCIQWSGFDLSLAKRVSNASIESYGRERFLVKGDILWNSTGTGTAGRAVVYPGPMTHAEVVADSHVTVIRLTNFLPDYLWCYLASPAVQQRMIPGQEKSMVTGTTNQVELSTSKVFGLPVPCPPVDEQKRIVAKVDELMALCDQLETQQLARRRSFPLVSRACHAEFTDVLTPYQLNRVFDEVDTVSPADFRKTVLILAVQGKLVPQDANDEPAEHLIGRVRAEKAKLIESGEIKRDKQLPPIDQQSTPFALPKGWAWCRLGDLTQAITSGSRGWAANYSETGPIFLRMGNLSRGSYRLRMNNVQRVNPPNDAEALRTRLAPGDVLISITGEVGLLGLVTPELGEAYINQHTCSVRFMRELRNRYFPEIFRSPFAQQQFNAPQRGIKNSFRLSDVAMFETPVPPLAEQLRIVAKVDKLMALIDILEEQHKKKHNLAEAFAQNCVASLTGASIETREKMKAPRTQLMSVVAVCAKRKPIADAPLATLLTKHKGELPAKVLWQQSGLSIDAFYQQLKIEIAQGWIAPPVEAEMKVVEAA